MLSLCGVSLRLAGEPFLENVDLKIERGHIYGFCGLDSMQSSALFGVLAGTLLPQSGHVTLSDLPLDEAAPFLKDRIGLIPQKLPSFAPVTVKEQLAFMLEAYGLRAAAQAERIRELLELSMLTGAENKLCQGLSFSEKRRLVIAQAMAGPLDYALFEMPFNNIDPHSSICIKKLMRTIAQTGAVALSCEPTREMFALCDVIYTLQEGRFVAISEVMQTG